jgi:hypothetical protein
VIAQVVPQATGRAVRLAFAQALGRFGKGGEVLFDRICRENGIVHRLTQPASPTTTGKVATTACELSGEPLPSRSPGSRLTGRGGWPPMP